LIIDRFGWVRRLVRSKVWENEGGVEVRSVGDARGCLSTVESAISSLKERTILQATYVQPQFSKGGELTHLLHPPQPQTPLISHNAMRSSSSPPFPFSPPPLPPQLVPVASSPTAARLPRHERCVPALHPPQHNISAMILQSQWSRSLQ
jgi:hypothetical protein